jgi:hypothetical protein
MAKTVRKNKWAFPVGLLIVLLAVIGVVFLILLSVDGIKFLTNDHKQKEEYETFLMPIVMNDPDPFDDITKANMEQLLDSAIWSLIRQNAETDKYEYDDDRLVIPRKDVENEFAKLFGTDTKPKHQTVSGSEYQFEYDEGKAGYKIPIFGMENTYTPKVIDIDKKNNSILLTVGYISGSEWAQDERGNLIEPDPSKYVRITIREKDNLHYVSAIQATDAPEKIK